MPVTQSNSNQIEPPPSPAPAHLHDRAGSLAERESLDAGEHGDGGGFEMRDLRSAVEAGEQNADTGTRRAASARGKGESSRGKYAWKGFWAIRNATVVVGEDKFRDHLGEIFDSSRPSHDRASAPTVHFV